MGSGPEGALDLISADAAGGHELVEDGSDDQVDVSEVPTLPLRPEVQRMLEQLQSVSAAATAPVPRRRSNPPVEIPSPGAAQAQAEDQDQPPSAPAALGNGASMGSSRDDRSWTTWSPDDVGDWVDFLLGPGQGQAFRQREVDGPTLMVLSEKDLQEALGISDALHRAKLLGHKRILEGTSADPADAPQELALAHEGTDSGFHREPAQERQALQQLDIGWPYARAPRRVTSSKSLASSKGMSRSESTALTISGGFLPGSSRYSGFIGANNNPATSGLVSLMGLDSPSNSVHGSFARASRLQHRQRAESPGPGAYEATRGDKINSKNLSPARATIGNSARQMPHQRAEQTGPGPQSYSVVSTAVPTTCSPRPTIGTSPREINRRRWDADIGTNAPSFYGSSTGGLNLRHASPRPVFGTSPRDCSKFFRPGGASMPDKASLRRDASPPPPSKSPSEASPELPKRQTFATATRNTDEFLGPRPDMSLRTSFSPSPKEKSRGGVIGSAPRFNRSGSPISLPQSPSPGPHSYRPSPAFLSTFRR